MNVTLPTRHLTVDEFLAWAVRQQEGKYELVDGVITMQQSQQWGHSKVKFEVALALREAIEKAGVAYFVASDGPTVRIDKHKAFVPDALVAPLPEPARHSLEIDDPIIVVEVLSPSTARMDATTKLRGYFKVASVQHYLIVDPEKRTVAHHRRSGAAVRTRTLRKGVLKLSPPGIELPLTEIFGPARPKSRA
jgi:Uma2 family endonuclease